MIFTHDKESHRHIRYTGENRGLHVKTAKFPFESRARPSQHSPLIMVKSTYYVLCLADSSCIKAAINL